MFHPTGDSNLSWQGFGNVPRGTLIMMGRCQLNFVLDINPTNLVGFTYMTKKYPTYSVGYF